MEIRDILSRVFRSAAQAEVLQRFCRSKADGVCRLPFYRFIFLLFYLFTVLPLFVSCSDGDDADSPQGPTSDNLQTVRLYLNVPSTQTSRAIGDPGYPTGEGEPDWDKLAVMIVYTDGTTSPMIKYLSIDEFNSLPMIDGNKNRRIYAIDAHEGTAHIYGVTYTEKYGKDIEEKINAIKTNDDIKELTIPNDYAENDDNSVAKFLSVATGFYDDNNDGKPDSYNIVPAIDWTDEKAPLIHLTRLAAKIDIQWDAQDAYEFDNNKTVYYENVVVKDFTFHNDATTNNTDYGSGRLFPSLAGEGAKSLGGSKKFVNQSPVSQRNGRVYHYVFPDGVSSPNITFNISADKKTSDDETSMSVSKTYTFQFSNNQRLEKATWYKINTTIRGLEKDKTTIEISPDATGSSTATN